MTGSSRRESWDYNNYTVVELKDKIKEIAQLRDDSQRFGMLQTSDERREDYNTHF